ncbi:type II and III secretion system protein family protein [Oryzibacter oryziterrae]|uniref:type II and III secretion system protein family protein n=1 Tax=Oryzibacter oryziterrae TaxID=2766474 RepID=UPI001F2D1EB7|nr:type II and III secretion system protein family protein [Oryzibacter oryziterrae]
MMRTFSSLLAAAVVALVASLSPVVSVAEAAAPIHMSAATTGQSFKIPKGVPQMIETTRPFSEIVVGDPSLADAWPLTDKTFMVLGNKGGLTGIVLFDKERNIVGAGDFEITLHTDRLQSALESKLPNADVDVSSANGSIVLSGTAADQKTIDEANQIASQFGGNVVNAVDIGGGKQVQLKVRFIEASRSASKDLGLKWAVAGTQTGVGVGSDTLPSGSTPFGEIISQIIGNGIGVDVLVQALEARGLARSLAEPNLVALSGQTSSFLAGGEFPIPVASDNGNVTIAFKKFGVSLDFTPTVGKDNLIHMQLKPEVSEIDYGSGIVADGITVPGLKVRRADSTLELRDGQSFVIAGLLQSGRSATRQRVPWLGDVPVLGALFRSTAYSRNETDLVIIVTPHIVTPTDVATDIPTPFDGARMAGDFDLFVNGKAEIPADMASYTANNGTATGGYILDLPALATR